jgi:1-acyl-sn-glycerol-3-phosphate acyltransferase
MIRTLATMLTILVLTPVLATMVIVASLLGVKPKPGGLLNKAPRWWAQGLLSAAGVDVVLHGEERMSTGEARVFVCNHVSWFDVLALAASLPRYSFVAKAELFRIPLFGRGALAVGTIPIERDNRKQAFESYKVAAEQIRAGASVVVYPEGTRGKSYALRPFKKGPFVLAVAAGVPVVPTIIHGSIEVLPRNSLRLHAGRTIHVHFLEPVNASGLRYDDRDRLMREVYGRMATGLRTLYGVESPGLESSPPDRAASA